MYIPYKEMKPTRHFNKKQKKEKLSKFQGDALKRKNKRDLNNRKYHEELLAEMEEVAETILNCTSGKLSSIVHDTFHESNLRNKETNTDLEKK